MDDLITRVGILEQQIADIFTDCQLKYPNLSPKITIQPNQQLHNYSLILFYVGVTLCGTGVICNYFIPNIKWRSRSSLKSACETLIFMSGISTVGLGISLFCDKFHTRF